MADALDAVLNKAFEDHAKSCEALTEAARKSIISDRANVLAMRHVPAGKWQAAKDDIEASLTEIFQMTKDGRLG